VAAADRSSAAVGLDFPQANFVGVVDIRNWRVGFDLRVMEKTDKVKLGKTKTRKTACVPSWCCLPQSSIGESCRVNFVDIRHRRVCGLDLRATKEETRVD